MSKQQAGTPPHWEKLMDLIAAAKSDRKLSNSLRTGTPAEVTTLLQSRGMTMDDLGNIFTDLELIADRGSLKYWSPLK